MKVIFLALLICYAISPFARMLMHNLHWTLYYEFNDIYKYIKEKQWQHFGEFGIDLFIYRHVW